DGITFALKGEERAWAVKLDFVGANPDAKPEGQDKQQAVFSYFKGPQKDWKTGLRTYSKVVYHDLWPGIDLVYSGTVNQLKYEFVVAPGADPAQIRLRYRGAENVAVTEGGALRVSTPVGGFEDAAPLAWQEIGGERVAVEMAYRLDPQAAGDTVEFDFALGAYDPAHPLVLDPAVLIYCGYLGGINDDYGMGIAVDPAGNAYVTGETNSTEQTFPVTGGPDLTHNGGFCDAFVVKVNAAGTALDYCGYLGGSGNDSGRGIAVDAAGNAHLTGWTNSTEQTFPVTGGPDLTHNGGFDAFVAKVNPQGTALVYCGYLGGSASDDGSGIAVDAAGNAYVTGGTQSTEQTFPVTASPDLTYNGGVCDSFVAKVNAAGTALVYCGYLGGSGADYGWGIAVDAGGNAYVTGYTTSTQQTFPVTGGPDLTHNGGEDTFVAKVNAAGTALLYCGYLGGSGNDSSLGIAVDATGNAYLAGYTGSTEQTFPVTGGPDLTHNGGTADAFVAKITGPCSLAGAGSPSPGGQVNLSLSSSGDAGLVYQLGSSLGNGSIPIDTRRIELSPDTLLVLTVPNAPPGIFQNYAGLLDAHGQAKAAIHIPSLPSLKGIRIYTAFVTLKATAPSGIASISNTFLFSIQ
ncbi:MAG: SBBP repeat-containing protein, partial [Planctomycetes bacterium]|nr:SBBP repeat-containing protein [Planctomycetota bacterium]